MKVWEVLGGAAALSVVVLFLWLFATSVPGLILGLMMAVLFAGVLAVSVTPAIRLPGIALILIPATIVVAWVLRVDRGDTHLSTELSTLIVLVFLYELASSRYRKRHARSDSAR